MKYYAVIDTNVLVSAMLKHHSVPGNIVDLAFNGPIVPVLNDAIEKEYRKVLSRPKGVAVYYKNFLTFITDSDSKAGCHVHLPQKNYL